MEKRRGREGEMEGGRNRETKKDRDREGERGGKRKRENTCLAQRLHHLQLIVKSCVYQ